MTPEVLPDFPEVVSQALTNIGEGGGMQSPLLATIIALESRDNSVHMTEAGTLVETLDQVKFTPKIHQGFLNSPIPSSRRTFRTWGCEIAAWISCPKLATKMLSSRSRTLCLMWCKKRSGKLVEMLTFSLGNAGKRMYASRSSGSTRTRPKEISRGWVDFHLARL